MRVPWRDRRGRFIPVKAVVLALVVVPGAFAAWRWANGQLGGRPVTEVIHETGLWAIRFVLISLAITPLRATLQWPQLLLVRRMVGVTAMAYALTHLTLYALDQKWKLLFVASEIVHRFYLTIGFVALLGLIALGSTSTDRAVQRMGRWWKRLHRLNYAIGVLALLHYFIQSKANVSEPVFAAGMFVWLMLWRVTPAGQRKVVVYVGLAFIAGLLTVGIEFAWYSLATRINPWRVLVTNENLSFGIRPAHWVVIVSLALTLVIAARKLNGRPFLVAWRPGQARP